MGHGAAAHPFKVTIATSGSRGDCQPYVALALELARRGHHACVATEERMRPLVEGCGVEWRKVSGDPTGLLWDKKVQVALRDGKVMQLMTATAEHNKKFYDQALQDYHAACAGADLIISAPLCMTQTMCIAQKLDVPWVPVLLGPTLPTGDFPLWAVASNLLPFKWLNRATYSLLFWALWKQEGPAINKWRRESLQLPALRGGAERLLHAAGGRIPAVVACSRFLIPGEEPPADWPDYARLTGAIFLDQSGAPAAALDPQLTAFLKAGEAPVYFGLGSMPCPEPRALLDLALQVVQRTGKRAVLCAGWTELEALLGPGEGQVQLPDSVLVVPSAHHHLLFPRCCALVHHCGVGTAGAALRSGVPSIPVPVMLDQPWVAGRLHRLGVAAAPIPFHRLTAAQLAEAVEAVTTGDAAAAMRARGAEIAAAVASEPGVVGAADTCLAVPALWGELTGKL